MNSSALPGRSGRPPAILILALVAACAWPGMAGAQADAAEAAAVEPQRKEDEATRLEDIQVTAEKRAKSQRDIPGSVGAIRGDALEQMNAQGMKDYLKVIPGVIYQDQGNEESAPVIRGITTGFNTGQVAAGTTGIYLDDMPFADVYIPLSYPDVNPFDLDRVEVLKGPQGTLYGASALAGAVRYIVHRPDFGVWGGKLSQTVSETKYGGGLATVTAGALNLPLLGDSLAVRAVGVGRREPGLYDAAATDNSGNTIRNDPDSDKLKQASGRVLASWNPPIDGLQLSAFYFGQKTRTDDIGIADQLDTPAAGHVNSYPFPSPRKHDFGGGNFLATYDFSWARVLSSTNVMNKKNYLDIQNEAATTGGHDTTTKDMIIIGNAVKSWTQELRLASPENAAGDWEWVTGASYMNWDMHFWELEWAGPAITDPTSEEQITAAQRSQALIFASLDELAHEKAVFGEVTRRLGERVEVALGARWFTDDLDGSDFACGLLIVALAMQQCIADHKVTGDRGLNPKVSLRYVHTANVQLYALAAKGFQFGGFQINPPVAAIQQSAQAGGYGFGPYKSSSLWNYESGVRTEWLERRLRFDVTFFYMDWKDLQMTVVVPLIAPTPGPNQQVTVLANVGRAHSTGLETALAVVPFTGAKWTSAAAWVNAVTDVPFDVSNPAGAVPPGTRLPGTPRFQWSNVLSYEHALPFFENWTVGPVLTHFHMSKAPNLLRATGTIGGYDTLDARLAFAALGSRYAPEVSLGVNNLLDARGVAAQGQGVGPPNEYHFVTPRTALVSLGLRY